MTTDNLSYSNPYSEKYLDLQNKFVELRSKLKSPWYAKFLMLDRDSDYENLEILLSFVTFSCGVIFLVSFCGLIVSEDIQLKLLAGTWFSWSGVFFSVLIAYWALQSRVRNTIKKSTQADIDTTVNSIPESTWLELTILLRDMTKADPLMANDPDDTYKAICHELALNLVTKPSSMNKLKALEYLFADYSVAGEKWSDLYEAIKSPNTTYFGYLCHRREVDEALEMENAKIEAQRANEQKLASLTGATV